MEFFQCRDDNSCPFTLEEAQQLCQKTSRYSGSENIILKTSNDERTLWRLQCFDNKIAALAPLPKVIDPYFRCGLGPFHKNNVYNIPARNSGPGEPTNLARHLHECFGAN